MSDFFYMQDSRSNVGSRAMFWRDGGGYTSNLDEAEQFTRERAVRQYECRETDLPWPVEYVRAMAHIGVDFQYLDLTPEQAITAAPVGERFYVAYKQAWDGNCLIWNTPATGPTSNLANASIWMREQIAGFPLADYVPWPKTYIDQHSRPVVPANLLNHKQALRSVGLKLPKIKPQRQKWRSYITNCHGCGRFLSEAQRYDYCPNCDASNAP